MTNIIAKISKHINTGAIAIAIIFNIFNDSFNDSNAKLFTRRHYYSNVCLHQCGT